MKRLKNIVVFTIILSLVGLYSVCGMEDTNNIVDDLEIYRLNDTIINYISEQVKESYSEYYNIPQISGKINNLTFKDNMIRAEINISFTKVLLAKSASELPYIQGLEKQAGEITNNVEKEYAEKYIKSRKKDINENYIGVKQNENANFIICIPLIDKSCNFSDSKMQFMGEFETLDMKEFSPSSRSQLTNNGEKDIIQLAKMSKQKALYSKARSTNPSSADDYDRIEARKYARKYAKNYNSSYSKYSSDCANFVSQCIHAGGIQQYNNNDSENDWYKDSMVWIRTGYYSDKYGITDYMVDQGFFFEDTNKYNAFAGSIISWTTFSHVGLVDQNDTVTMTYCAHTNDRLSQSFKNMSNVKFYIPEWDSYSGEWTR